MRRSAVAVAVAATAARNLKPVDDDDDDGDGEMNFETSELPPRANDASNHNERLPCVVSGRWPLNDANRLAVLTILMICKWFIESARAAATATTRFPVSEHFAG